MNGRWDALAAAWAVLAGLLREPPTPRALATLRADAGRGEWPLPVGPRTAEGLTLVAGSNEPAEAVADDHFRLLRGPGQPLAVPWASVHLSQDALLFDEETFAVRQAYARHGLAVPHVNREPDDHISLELEFLATLLVRALEAAGADDPARAEELVAAHDEFCRDHLLPFGPDFFAAVEQHAATSLYRGVGVLGADALAQVAEDLRDG